MQPCSYGVANITADKEVTLLSRQCIFLGHLSMRINKFIKKEKKKSLCTLVTQRANNSLKLYVQEAGCSQFLGSQEGMCILHQIA